MIDSSLIPERQLVFSPALAETIGLEEAILLQHLGELFRHRKPQLRDGFQWLSVERQWLLDSLPFWSLVDLHRISKSLVDKGVLLVSSAPLHESDKLIFAINQQPEKKQRRASTAASQASGRVDTGPKGATLMSAGWTPGEDVLALLAMNHNIPRQYALEQLEDFVQYWTERGEISHAWENKFRQHVLSRWRKQEQDAAERFSPPDTPVDNNWRPSEDALEIMLRSGVSREFIDDAIPEYILFRRESGKSIKTMNSGFISHIRRQWARYNSALSHDTEPQRIPENWQPADDVFDILNLSHIDADFARELLPEFIVYWRDSNKVYSSWNTKFLQHVKYKWANRHQFETNRDQHHASQQRPGSAGSTRSRKLSDDLADRSWAH